MDPTVIRTFKIEFQCADYPVAVPIHALEYHHCEYTINVPSVFGTWGGGSGAGFGFGLGLEESRGMTSWELFSMGCPIFNKHCVRVE